MSLPIYNGVDQTFSLFQTNWKTQLDPVIDSYLAVGTLITNQNIHPTTGLFTGVVSNITSINIPAGEWDVWGAVNFTGALSSSSQLQLSINPAINTIGNLYDGSTTTLAMNANSTSVSFQVGPFPISLKNIVPYYLNVQATFGGGAAIPYGTIYARLRKNTQ